METAGETGEGLGVAPIAEAEFREFVRRHGSSDEIGPIGTYLDDAQREHTYGAPHLWGLYGCGDLCAVVCCTISPYQSGAGHACKLDSIIVHQSLRREGLGAALVCRIFQHLMEDARFDVTSIFSYAVHPATVRMLGRLGFSAPPPRGAPLCSLRIGADNRKQLATALNLKFQDTAKKLKLRCTYCLGRDRRSRPWCAHQLP